MIMGRSCQYWPIWTGLQDRHTLALEECRPESELLFCICICIILASTTLIPNQRFQQTTQAFYHQHLQSGKFYGFMLAWHSSLIDRLSLVVRGSRSVVYGEVPSKWPVGTTTPSLQSHSGRNLRKDQTYEDSAPMSTGLSLCQCCLLQKRSPCQ